MSWITRVVFTHLRCPDDRGRTASAAPVVANRSQEVPVTTTQEKSAARTTAEGWLTAFADALSARDIDRAGDALTGPKTKASQTCTAI